MSSLLRIFILGLDKALSTITASTKRHQAKIGAKAPCLPPAG
jgi:hypothetical protein